jgi:hypothetical protein
MADEEKIAKPKARIKIKEHFEARVLEAEKRTREDVNTFGGYDWFQLSAAEEEVFAIKRERYARVLEAWKLYQSLMDIVWPPDHGFDERLVMAERKNWPGLDLKHKRITTEQFQEVAKELCGVTFRESYAIFMKIEFWNLRIERISYRDEQE